MSATDQTLDQRAALEARVAELRARDTAEEAKRRERMADPAPVAVYLKRWFAKGRELEERAADPSHVDPQAQENRRKAEVAAREQRDERWRLVAPEVYWATTFDNLPANTVPILDNLRAYAAAVVADRSTAGNLVLTGELGAGKTSSAAAVGRHVSDAGGKVRMVLVGEWVTEMQAHYGRTLRDYFGFDLLILDDLGEQRAPSEFMLDQFYNLIYRYKADRRPLIVTTNLRPLVKRHKPPHPKAGQPIEGERGLDSFLSAATYDRLRHNLQVLTVTGDSNRRTHRELQEIENA